MQMNLINCYYGWNLVFHVSAIHVCSMFMIFYATKSKKKIPVCDIDIQSHNYFFSIFMSWSHLIRDHHVLKNFSLVVTLLLFILQSSLDFFCIQKLYNWWRHVTQSSDQRQEKYTVKHSLNCYTITVTPRILLYSVIYVHRYLTRYKNVGI